MGGAEITITFLGTGSAVPDLDRQQSCVALRHQNGLVLFDCGEGSQYAMRKNKISTRKEVVIWISHLHSDHFLGLPGLLASFELLGREEPVTIVGPEYIIQTVKNLMIANYVKTTYEVRIMSLQPGEQFVGSGYILETIAAKHANNALSVIWRENAIPGKVMMEKLQELGLPPGSYITELQNGKNIEINGIKLTPTDVIGDERPGRSVFYSGDTEANEAIVEFAKECDLFIHEATYGIGMDELAKERQHSTVTQVAILAKSAHVKKTILTHISPRIQDYKAELEKASKYVIDIHFAFDGMIVELEYPYRD